VPGFHMPFLRCGDHLIAKAIVSVTASGEHNPKEVMERTLNALGVRRDTADRRLEFSRGPLSDKATDWCDLGPVARQHSHL